MNKRYLHSVACLTLIFGLTISIQGCFVWNIIDTGYQNVTGYFNTYYNASRLFNEAVEEINSQKAPPPEPMEEEPQPVATDAGVEQPVSRAPKREIGVPSSAVQKLDKVIEKCSRILINYSKSTWVENALLMIGRCFYYKREYSKAERKFKELLDGFPGSSLADQGLLWLGRNYIMLELFDSAERTLIRAIEQATEESNPDVVAEAHFSLGEMYLLRYMQKEAVEYFQKGAEIECSNDIRIRLQLALAREQERLKNNKAAAKAYKDIIKSNPDRELRFQAELNFARLSRETGEIDDAVNTLLDMLDNPLYLEYDSEIQLEIGHLYEAIREYKAAVDQFTYVDTTFRNQPVAAEASYALGKIYELQAKNYDKAFDHYNQARTAYPGIQAAKLGGKRADDLGEYRKLRNRMFDLDTLLFFVLHPDSLATRDSLQQLAAQELKMKGSDGEKTEEQLLAEKFARRRPHGRNTGRINPWIQQKSTLATVTTVGGLQTLSASAPLYRKLNIRALSADSVLQVLSAMRMELGWVLFDRIGDLDSAFFYYRLALDGKLSDSLKGNAYYTLAEISRKIGDESLANDYEDRLIRELPSTRYAQSIMKARGMELVKDSLTIAREAYERAARLLEDKQYQRGIEALQAMAKSYPNSDQAVRAHLAIAMTYENPLDQGEKALEVYRQMVKDYPNSRYTMRAREVLEAIDRAKNQPQQEKKKIEEQNIPEQKSKEVEKQPTKDNGRLEEELRLRDSLRTKPKLKIDPTLDQDFPLQIPGEGKPQQKKAPESQSQSNKPTDLPQTITDGEEPSDLPVHQNGDNVPMSIPLPKKPR